MESRTGPPGDVRSIFKFLFSDFRIAALTDGFEEHYARSYRNIERLHGAGRGDRNQEIAALAGEFVQPFTFTAQYDPDRSF